MEFRIKATANCRTKNVVYLIECAKCLIQYVREMENALRTRLTEHRSDINHQRLGRPVAQHFNQPHHSLKNLTIMVMKKSIERMLTSVNTRRATGLRPSNLYRPTDWIVIPRSTPFRIYELNTQRTPRDLINYYFPPSLLLLLIWCFCSTRSPFKLL